MITHVQLRLAGIDWQWNYIQCTVALVGRQCNATEESNLGYNVQYVQCAVENTVSE